MSDKIYYPSGDYTGSVDANTINTSHTGNFLYEGTAPLRYDSQQQIIAPQIPGVPFDLQDFIDNFVTVYDDLTIKIKYFVDDIDKVEKISKGDWIDLRAAETVILSPGERYTIPLGVAMKLPNGYEAHVAPRSSSFKQWGFLQTNSVGVVDSSYCGDNDQWVLLVYATRDAVINKNDRICQFRIMENQPNIEFEFVDKLDDQDRGGLGSTGVK